MSCNYSRSKCLFLNGKEDGCIACPIKMAYNKGYNQGFKDGKECTLVSIDAIEDITDRMISIISEMNWEKLLKEANKRPQGNWIEGTQGHYCSECDTVDQFYYEHDFCPKCGADMRGEK